MLSVVDRLAPTSAFVISRLVVRLHSTAPTNQSDGFAKANAPPTVAPVRHDIRRFSERVLDRPSIPASNASVQWQSVGMSTGDNGATPKTVENTVGGIPRMVVAVRTVHAARAWRIRTNGLMKAKSSRGEGECS